MGGMGAVELLLVLVVVGLIFGVVKARRGGQGPSTSRGTPKLGLARNLAALSLAMFLLPVFSGGDTLLGIIFERGFDDLVLPQLAAGLLVIIWAASSGHSVGVLIGGLITLQVMFAEIVDSSRDFKRLFTRWDMDDIAVKVFVVTAVVSTLVGLAGLRGRLGGRRPAKRAGALAFLGSFKKTGVALPSRPPIQRHDMLRHNEFYQFGRLVMNQRSTPHEVHWGIRDLLQDAGATINKEWEAQQSAHCTMTLDSHVGTQDGCESDYVTFGGALVASKGKHVPRWLILVAIVIAFVGFAVAAAGFPGAGALSFLAVMGLGLYAYWIHAYGRGKLFALYEGVYRRPESGAQIGAGSRAWEFQLDIMLSYKVEIPPFGIQPLGPEVVQPVFEAAKQNLIAYARTGLTEGRYQPQLLSSYRWEYAERFPVEIER